MIASPSVIGKFYRGVKHQEHVHSNQLKHLSKIKSSIRNERGIHITTSGSRYTPARMEKRRQYQRAYYAKHAEEINREKRDQYHSDLECSRSIQREKYYRIERNKEKRRIYDQINKEKINARKRDYYSRNRVRLQTLCKLRRSDPVYRKHQNQLDKLRRLRKGSK